MVDLQFVSAPYELNDIGILRKYEAAFNHAQTLNNALKTYIEKIVFSNTKMLHCPSDGRNFDLESL